MPGSGSVAGSGVHGAEFGPGVLYKRDSQKQCVDGQNHARKDIWRGNCNKRIMFRQARSPYTSRSEQPVADCEVHCETKNPLRTKEKSLSQSFRALGAVNKMLHGFFEHRCGRGPVNLRTLLCEGPLEQPRPASRNSGPRKRRKLRSSAENRVMCLGVLGVQ